MAGSVGKKGTNMIYFCSDLDNTLIYSYRRDIGDEKILVETKEGKELSYMSKVSYELLQEVTKKVELVPLTTRSLEQYNRINFGNQVKIKYALVANGGILLENNKINEAWFRTSKEMISSSEEEMEKGIQLLKKDKNVCFEIRKVDEMCVFTKSDNVEETIQRLKEELDEETVYISAVGVKVYIFPKVLDKGSALKRFRDYVGKEHHFVSAGDSCFDVPMLLAADTSFCPNSLEVPEKNSITKLEEKGFSDEMLQRVLNLKV